MPVTPPPGLASIQAQAAALSFGMGSDELTGCLLRTLAASKPAGRFLEIGTGCGAGAAWLLAGMDAHGTLVSVDNDAAAQAVARDVLGGDTRLTLVEEDGAGFLSRCAAASFDLVFADSWPGKFWALEEALRVVKPGGFYLVDDLAPQPNWPEGHAAKIPVVRAALRARPDFVLTEMDWSTGLVLAVRRNGI